MGIVIKPNNTNFGVGISILEKNSSEADFRQALNNAFSFDTSVIIEEFIPGKEYRFLIINNEVIAVLHREAANVIGDGVHTVIELIEEKNKHPFRGTGYKKPLEKIEAGPTEAYFLESHGKNFSSVPQNGEKEFLRKNSNISTGGDSIDYTDSVSAVYKEIAVKAAAAVGAKICGADIIIQELDAEPDENNYGVIELNFNPAIHIHSYPYRGKNRYAEKKILDLLGFMEGV
jgi:D-alanine-D-alanine ligase-like ATP-grasp enzyme